MTYRTLPLNLVGRKKRLTCAAGWLLATHAAVAQMAEDESVVTIPKALSEVVISAAGYEQEQANAPATISVITAKELEGKYYRDITDALQDIPGVSIEGGGNGPVDSTSINIRGMSESYVLFLIDGKPVGASEQAYYNGFGGGAKTSLLPPVSAIERIEVIRGPMSSLYGSSALGGVINIITKKVSSDWSGSVTSDTTIQQNPDSGTTYQGRFYVSGPLAKDKLNLAVYGSKFHRSEDKIERGYPRKNRQDLTAKLNWVIDASQSLEFQAGYAENKNSHTKERGWTSDTKVYSRQPSFGLTHDIRWGNRLSTRSFVTYEKVDIENDGTRGGGVESSYGQWVVNTKTVLPFDRHVMTVGADYKSETTEHDPSRFPGSIKINLKRWQVALFAEDEYFVSDQFSVTSGLRIDRDQYYGNEVTPRVYGIYHVTPQWTIKGGVSGGYKTPTLKEADDNIVEYAGGGRSLNKGNKNLKPERSTNYELGVVWASDQQLSFSATYFNTRFKDRISRETICASPDDNWDCYYNGVLRQFINRYINEDRANLQGLELNFTAMLGPVKLRTNYTWSDSEITVGSRKGLPFNNLPRHMFNVGADWQIDPQWALWGRAKYKSKTLDEANSQYPAYALVDVGMTYDINKRVQVFGGIYNVFDKEISREVFGKTLDGRRFYVGITGQF